jgi:hypothetical protein
LAGREWSVKWAVGLLTPRHVVSRIWKAVSPTLKSLSAHRGEHMVCGEVLADALDVKAVADRLGVSAASVHEMVVAGDLAALRLGGVWRLPAWQFGADGLLPGVSDLLASWPGSFLSLSVWACTPSARLQGRTPTQALTDSDPGDAMSDALATCCCATERDGGDTIHSGPRRGTRRRRSSGADGHMAHPSQPRVTAGTAHRAQR